VKWQQQWGNDDDPILAMLKSRRKAYHAGPLGQLKPLEDTLLRYVFEQRKQGITVQMFDLVIKASSLSSKFDVKHFVSKCSAVKCFVRANLLVYRMGMHVTRLRPEDVVTEVSDFMNLMHPFLDGPHCDRHFILNMDQTPVYFSMMAKWTFDVIGVKTVHIRSTANDTKRVTVRVTIAANGTVLPLTSFLRGSRMVVLQK
jgi:hypothetical protein